MSLNLKYGVSNSKIVFSNSFFGQILFLIILFLVKFFFWSNTIFDHSFLVNIFSLCSVFFNSVAEFATAAK